MNKCHHSHSIKIYGIKFLEVNNYMSFLSLMIFSLHFFQVIVCCHTLAGLLHIHLKKLRNFMDTCLLGSQIMRFIWITWYSLCKTVIPRRKERYDWVINPLHSKINIFFPLELNSLIERLYDAGIMNYIFFREPFVIISKKL